MQESANQLVPVRSFGSRHVKQGYWKQRAFRCPIICTFLLTVTASTACSPMFESSGRLSSAGRLASSVLLCPPKKIPARQLSRSRLIVDARLRTYHLKFKITTEATGCVRVRTMGRLGWVKLLALDLAHKGLFVEGPFVPPLFTTSGSRLYVGSWVRYHGEPITSRNWKRLVVRPIITSRDITHVSVLRGPGGYSAVSLRLTTSGRRIYCRAVRKARRNEAYDQTLDHQIITLGGSGGPTRICIGAPGVAALSRPHPPGPTSLPSLVAFLRFGPFPFDWASVRYGTGQHLIPLRYRGLAL